ncbi:MAG: hypothetical protein MRY63_05065 [Neomegalonema sp.]|nr:hypothetical protein [Neomegalonema sp.]
MIDASGVPVAGAIAPALRLSMAQWTSIAIPGADSDEDFWVIARPVEAGAWVAIAHSREAYHDTGELMITGAIWTLLTAGPLALLTGALLSRAVDRLGCSKEMFHLIQTSIRGLSLLRFSHPWPLCLIEDR